MSLLKRKDFLIPVFKKLKLKVEGWTTPPYKPQMIPKVCTDVAPSIGLFSKFYLEMVFTCAVVWTVFHGFVVSLFVSLWPSASTKY